MNEIESPFPELTERHLHLISIVCFGIAVLGIGIFIGYLLANTEIAQCINTLAEYETKCSQVKHDFGGYGIGDLI